MIDEAASQDKFQRSIEVGKVFTPTSPVDEAALFAGRKEQLRRVIDAINQKGQHSIVFGERGVGKTSLSNVLQQFIGNVGAASIITPRVNCDSTDTFESIFRKVFNEIDLVSTKKGIGFTATSTGSRINVNELVAEITPDNVRRALTQIEAIYRPVIILDEFDRLSDDAKHAIADTIKSLSDHAVGATIVVVGVADSVMDLIREHASVERALVQVHMPRMSRDEIIEILLKGGGRLGLTFDTAAANIIAGMAQGLPHYAHLLALHAARNAIERDSSTVEREDLTVAIDEAIEGSQHSIRHLYHGATMSPRKDNLFTDVLTACAMAGTDDLGYFAAQDVRTPMQQITGKPYDINSYSQHLNEFTEEKRGPILKKIGTPRRYRFRFVNPLMQPFVLMQAVRAKKIDVESFC